MRRRRQVLQVSTFPFLAVLLCTMGSLILLLLVLDRRARIVAQAKAHQVAARAAADEARAAAARQAEWERRRQALHAVLERQRQDLRAEVTALHSQIAAAAAEAGAEQARSRALEDRLQAEQPELERAEQALAARRAARAREAEQAEAAQKELARLSAELTQLERTLAGLQAARQRERRTYSLVPYRGKRCDDRRPVYIECTATGLVFHPDRFVLEGPVLPAASIRSEVVRRLSREPPARDGAGGNTDASSYLLMLIRPDGIRTYYRTLAALEGLKVEFGYELVEADWVLDCSADPQAPGPSPGTLPRPAGAARALTGGGEAEPPRPPGAQLLPPTPAASGAFSESVPGGDRKGVGTRDGRGSHASSTSSRNRPSAPAQPDRAPSNRDWVLAVECTAGTVLLHPTGLRIEMVPSSQGEPGTDQLRRAVHQLIARRQATVRPGESPYRPLIRFLVRPDGLRTYHLAFPALESLRVPMARINLEQDEELRPELFAR